MKEQNGRGTARPDDETERIIVRPNENVTTSIPERTPHMNDPIKQHIEEHKQEHEKLERTINENLTIIIGQNWRSEENLRLFRAEMNEHLIRMNDRVTRLDDRVTGAHRDIAQLEIAMQKVATKDDLTRLEDLIKKLLPPKPGE